MSNDVQGQGPVERQVRPDSEARHLPTPDDLRNYADDADQHGNHWVPIAPASLRGLADEIERLRAELCLTIADTDAKAIDFVRLLAKANDQAEHFERNWYLRGDAIEAARPAMREYAAKNPKHHFGETLQDPCGVHAWLAVGEA